MSAGKPRVGRGPAASPHPTTVKSKTCTGSKTGRPLTEYGSEGEALEAAQYAGAAYGRKLAPYLCSACGRWHLALANRQTPSRKCLGCTGGDGQPKDAYRSEKEAQLRARIIRKESGVLLRAYPCPCGSGWHLTKA